MGRPDGVNKAALLAAAGWLIVLLGAGGCGPNDEVSGIWDNVLNEPWVRDLPEEGADPSCWFFDSQRYLRLVLGQYGYEVAGIVQFCPTHPCRPEERPSCTPIEGGRMRGDTLTFAFRACRDDNRRLRAELTLNPDPEDPWLEGPVCPSEATDCYAQRLAAIKLAGHQTERVSADEKSCRLGDRPPQRPIPLPDATAADDAAGGADAGP